MMLCVLKSVVFAVVVGVAAACGSVETRDIVIGTGPVDGAYYPYGQALAEILTREVPGGRFSAVATGASVDNLTRMHSSDPARHVDMALTLGDTLAQAVAGEGPFAPVGKVDAKAIAILYTNYTHFIVKKDSGITQIADLKGRTVATGAVGSGTEVIANRLLEVAGLNPQSDITRMSLGTTAATAALVEGRIDAMFLSGGVPAAPITALASNPDVPVQFLPTAHLVPALVNKYGPLYRASDIIARSYAGIEDVAVVGVSNVLAVSGSLPPEFVQAITATLYDHNETLAVVVREARGLAWPRGPGAAPAPFHPGAEAYYRLHAWR